ncbi:MAG: prolyl-tRNA synthetase associated domain-containing protein [Clostridia bacterium]|nr:prolyl-tRNA synthetase associated domain-containing protein [Clostridia bacterium]
MCDTELILEQGRPASVAGRAQKEIEIYDFLDNLGVPYARVDHAPAMTMADCEKTDQVLGTAMCKNLFLANRQGTAFYLLLMPGDKPFRTKNLSAVLGVARLSFGTPEKMEELLGVLPGSATVLGLAYDREKVVTLVIDRAVLSGEYIGCHPMVNTASLRIKTVDLLEKILPATGHAPVLVDLPRETE